MILVMTENPTLRALQLNPEQMFSVVDCDSGEVLGWSETGPELMSAVAEKLITKPSRFNHLEVVGPGGEIISVYRR